MALPHCSVGAQVGEQCYLTCFVKKDTSLVTLDEVDIETVKKIKYRTQMNNVPSICKHHLVAYSKYFENHVNRSNKCRDPFKLHKQKSAKSTKKVSLDFCESLLKTGVHQFHIYPGLKLCIDCYAKMLSSLESSDQSPLNCSSSSMEDLETVFNNDDNEFTSPLHGLKVANKAAELVGISPVQLNPKESKSCRAKLILKKSEQVREKFQEILSDTLTEDNITLPTNSNFLSNDLEQLMKDLKLRCNTLKQENNNQSAIISLLTLAPISWTIAETASYFNVSVSEVRRARILKSEKGILSMPDKRKGRAMSEEEKKIVTDFYESDDYSRMQPGMNDSISVRVNENKKKVKVQKRLLLMNIDELYSKYKDYCSTTLFMKPCGRTKFFMNRPEHVVEVGAKGTHNVCVCEKYQNVKLMVDALCRGSEQKYLFMDRIVCDIKEQVCMMKRCGKCPGIISLRPHILEIVGDRRTIKYKMWVSTDRSMLEHKESSASDFIDCLLQKIDSLTTHHFIAKAQTKFCRDLKENITANECLIQGDFSQNYSMFIQDSTQASFFNPVAQATIHPFLVYINQGGKITPHSIAVISDCNSHNTVAVHTFLRPVLSYVKQLCPVVEIVKYFTDGAASQYKNYKNLANLTQHFADFNLQAEWHFFATSHGKGPCDGIGGTIKRLARRQSPQSVNNSESVIQTPRALFEFANSHIENIKIFFVSTEEVNVNEEQLRKRFENAKTVPGTQSFHKFVPVDTKTIEAFELSNSIEKKSFIIMRECLPVETIDFKDLRVHSVIACVYDGEWYLATITELNNEAFEAHVHFYTPNGSEAEIQGFKKSKKEDTAWMPLKSIIKITETLKNTSFRGRTYKMDAAEREIIEKRFSEIMRDDSV